jgi:hypothetical protein
MPRNLTIGLPCAKANPTPTLRRIFLSPNTARSGSVRVSNLAFQNFPDVNSRFLGRLLTR